MNFPLFEIYPALPHSVPRESLGIFPTPIRRMDTLSAQFPGTSLYVKDDGLTAPAYGGNKVRKLEFLLADAREQGADTTVTYGFAGSNHALATAVHAHALGMQPISVLLHQPNAAYVRKNLLYSLAAGTRIIECGSFEEMDPLTDWLRAELKSDGRTPYVIPPGGSSPAGNLGYVNAAFELMSQVENAEIPEPDLIYLPLGTMGTVCGLALGLKLAGLTAKIRAVCVVDPEYATDTVCRRIFSETRGFLQRSVPEAADCSLDADDITLTPDFFGDGYACFTDAGREGIRLFTRTEQLALEGSYTGKTAAAMLADARKGTLEGQNVLFWKTCNSADFSKHIENVDYHDLPQSFYRYFETKIQPL